MNGVGVALYLAYSMVVEVVQAFLLIPPRVLPYGS